MAKIRVYQLAKELSVENAELIDKLKSFGFEVKNHMSTLSEGEVDRVRSDYTKTEEVKVDEIRIKPGIIRRRKKAEVPVVVEAVEEVAAEPVLEAGEAETAAANAVNSDCKQRRPQYGPRNHVGDRYPGEVTPGRTSVAKPGRGQDGSFNESRDDGRQDDGRNRNPQQQPAEILGRGRRRSRGAGDD